MCQPLITYHIFPVEYISLIERSRASRCDLGSRRKHAVIFFKFGFETRGLYDDSEEVREVRRVRCPHRYRAVLGDSMAVIKSAGVIIRRNG